MAAIGHDGDMTAIDESVVAGIDAARRAGWRSFYEERRKAKAWARVALEACDWIAAGGAGRDAALDALKELRGFYLESPPSADFVGPLDEIIEWVESA